MNRPPNIAPQGHPGEAATRPIVGYESQIAILRRKMARRRVSLERGIASLDLKNVPPQCHLATYTGQLITNIPQLLIPANPTRMSIIAAVSSNFSGTAFLSYGYPVSNLGPTPLGIPFYSDDFFEELNGTTSIDDIWVWTNTGGGTSTVPVIGYEGILAIESNP